MIGGVYNRNGEKRLQTMSYSTADYHNNFCLCWLLSEPQNVRSLTINRFHWNSNLRGGRKGGAYNREFRMYFLFAGRWALSRGSALVNIRRKALGHLMKFTQGRLK